MNWEYVVADRDFTKAEIATVVSTVFSTPIADVLVLDDIADDTIAISRNIRLICERQSVSGDFVMSISFYVHDPEIRQHAEQVGSEQIVGEFCDLFHCKCLMSDNSVNPYSWLLVEGVGKVHPVELNEHYLDADESRYVIDESVPRNNKVSQVA